MASLGAARHDSSETQPRRVPATAVVLLSMLGSTLTHRCTTEAHVDTRSLARHMRIPCVCGEVTADQILDPTTAEMTSAVADRTTAILFALLADIRVAGHANGTFLRVSSPAATGAGPAVTGTSKAFKWFARTLESTVACSTLSFETSSLAHEITSRSSCVTLARSTGATAPARRAAAPARPPSPRLGSLSSSLAFTPLAVSSPCRCSSLLPSVPTSSSSSSSSEFYSIIPPFFSLAAARDARLAAEDSTPLTADSTTAAATFHAMQPARKS